MALTFKEVPEWTSWENQGAGIAVADLGEDGFLDLIVLRADHRTPGPNQGFYRVGKKLDSAGNINGGWGTWKDVPNWGADENEGAGIAVAKFGAGDIALIVMQIQHNVPGPNQGRYCIGRKVDADGNVTGKWTDWKDVPGWTSWRDQGSGIAVADVTGNGNQDLIIFHVDDFHTDNPRRPNKGFYRIGFDISPDGDVDHWSEWFEVDWFSWFNQGAGIAVADLDGNGRPEIIIFQIDNPAQENAGYYRVGWNLDQKGRVQDGWGPWTKLDDWNSWEDQGGGFSLAHFNGGRPRAVVFHTDNPDGLNKGLYAVTDLVLDIDTADTKGLWRLLPYFSEVLPVHAGLLHTGKVIFFAGSGNNAFRSSSPDFGNLARKIFTSVIWDPRKNILDENTFDHPLTLHRDDGSVIDFFCCGHSFLPDGRVFVIGGTRDYDKIVMNGVMKDAGHGFTGTKDALIFDPVSETWSSKKPMAHGRWYPSVVLMSDESVLALSGLDENGNTNETIERNTHPDQANWIKARDFALPLYPHVFLLSDGNLIYTGGKMDTEGDSDPFVFDPVHPTNSMLIGGLEDRDKCNQCASVVMPPTQLQRFMILGGGPEDEGQVRGRATKRVAILDLKKRHPTYEQKERLEHERMHVNAVLLPDRTILAVGGGVTREATAQTAIVDPEGGREVFEGEIYDPATDHWAVTAAATVARLYHSVALLLPDGRVVAAGGNPDKGSQVAWLPPDPLEEMRLEIFSPPYLFKKSARPVIEGAPQEIKYDSSVDIQVNDSNRIKWINLIAPGLTTHSFNGTQRLVDLPFDSHPPKTLFAKVVKNPNLAPPGWYMLFLTSVDGVPSVARWVHLS